MTTARTSRLAALIAVATGLLTVLPGPSEATPSAPVRDQPAFCTDSSLLPGTPDAAAAWLRSCPDRDSGDDNLPKTPDAAAAWLARR